MWRTVALRVFLHLSLSSHQFEDLRPTDGVLRVLPSYPPDHSTDFLGTNAAVT